MLVHVYWDNVMKKTAVYSGWNVLLREGKVSLTRRDQDGQQQAELKKTIQKFVKLYVKTFGWLSGAQQSGSTSTDKTVRKILTEDLDMRKVCAKMVPKELTENKSKEESQCAKAFWRGKMTFWAMSSKLMIHGSTNTTLKRSRKVHSGRLQIPHDQKFPSVQIKSKKFCWLFLILEELFIMNLYQLDKQSTKFTTWKYWKGCVEKLDGNGPNFLQKLTDPASWQCTCSHGTVCEGVFSF